eukprot:scaffold6.g2699.t1
MGSRPPMGLRVLVVDPAEASRTHTEKLLQATDFQVSVVGTGAEAMELMAQQGHTFDIVLKDHEPPLSNALRFMRKLRGEGKQVPVVVVSTQDSHDTVFRCIRNGAADYLVKPLRLNELRNLWTRVWQTQGVGHQQAGHPEERRPDNGSGDGSEETCIIEDVEPTSKASKEGSAPDEAEPCQTAAQGNGGAGAHADAAPAGTGNASSDQPGSNNWAAGKADGSGSGGATQGGPGTAAVGSNFCTNGSNGNGSNGNGNGYASTTGKQQQHHHHHHHRHHHHHHHAMREEEEEGEEGAGATLASFGQQGPFSPPPPRPPAADAEPPSGEPGSQGNGATAGTCTGTGTGTGNGTTGNGGVTSRLAAASVPAGDAAQDGEAEEAPWGAPAAAAEDRAEPMDTEGEGGAPAAGAALHTAPPPAPQGAAGANEVAEVAEALASLRDSGPSSGSGTPYSVGRTSRPAPGSATHAGWRGTASADAARPLSSRAHPAASQPQADSAPATLTCQPAATMTTVQFPRPPLPPPLFIATAAQQQQQAFSAQQLGRTASLPMSGVSLPSPAGGAQGQQQFQQQQQQQQYPPQFLPFPVLPPFMAPPPGFAWGGAAITGQLPGQPAQQAQQAAAAATAGAGAQQAAAAVSGGAAVKQEAGAGSGGAGQVVPVAPVAPAYSAAYAGDLQAILLAQHQSLQQQHAMMMQQYQLAASAAAAAGLPPPPAPQPPVPPPVWPTMPAASWQTVSGPGAPLRPGAPAASSLRPANTAVLPPLPSASGGASGAAGGSVPPSIGLGAAAPGASAGTSLLGGASLPDLPLLSGEERSRREARAAALHKYREKRKRLNFGKKIRYQSRKALAEARPRVKGQFVRVAKEKMGQEVSSAGGAAAGTAGAGPDQPGRGLKASKPARKRGTGPRRRDAGRALAACAQPCDAPASPPSRPLRVVEQCAADEADEYDECQEDDDAGAEEETGSGTCAGVLDGSAAPAPTADADAEPMDVERPVRRSARRQGRRAAERAQSASQSAGSKGGARGTGAGEGSPPPACSLAPQADAAGTLPASPPLAAALPARGQVLRPPLPPAQRKAGAAAAEPAVGLPSAAQKQRRAQAPAAKRAKAAAPGGRAGSSDSGSNH